MASPLQDELFHQFANTAKLILDDLQYFNNTSVKN